MFTISQRKDGKSTIYTKNNEEGRALVGHIVSEFSHVSPRVRPLMNGRIAVDIRKGDEGLELINKLLTFHQEEVDRIKRARWEAEHREYEEWLEQSRQQA